MSGQDGFQKLGHDVRRKRGEKSIIYTEISLHPVLEEKRMQEGRVYLPCTSVMFPHLGEINGERIVKSAYHSFSSYCY